MKTFVLGAALLAAMAGAGAADYRALPGGRFRTVLPADGQQAPAAVAPFQMRATLVSNGESRDFLASHPEWRRGQLPAVLAGPGYLAGWRSDADFGPLDADAPVTQVSWQAAAAFCASEGSRSQGTAKQLDNCGGAAVSLGDRRNYAVLMRVALLAAMEGAQDGPFLGFRCARNQP